MNTPFLREIRADARREDVLNAIAWRFDPSLSVYHQLEAILTAIKEEKTFSELLKTVIQSSDFAEFQQTLRRLTNVKSTTEPTV